ncbi:MAG: acyl-ACP--UDP-N-acetylglucosamine O-acyltransferase, partial [Nevskiales bacterium]
MISEDARIHPDAKLGNNVQVGPFSIIGANVEIGDDSVIGPHVVIDGHTRIGKANQVFQFTSIGAPPQHKAYKGEPTRVEIGDRNVLREFVSVHCGTTLDNSVTRIGDDNMLMAYVHIAHDCSVANNVTMANGASLAGHTHVDDYCILGGFALVHQFTRIGEGAFLGYGSGVGKDVPPFVMASGYPAAPHGVNSEGMRRRGFKKEDIELIRDAYRTLYRSKLRLVEAKEQLAARADASLVLKQFCDFLN